MATSENLTQETAKTALRGGPSLLPFKSLRGKATLYVLLLLAGTVVAAYAITLRTMNGHVRGEIVKRAESLSRSIASAAGYNLILEDVLALDNMVFKIKESNPDILSIAIVGPDKKAIVHSEAGRAGTVLEPSQGRIVGRGAYGTWVKEIGPPRRPLLRSKARSRSWTRTWGRSSSTSTGRCSRRRGPMPRASSWRSSASSSRSASRRASGSRRA